MSCLVLGGTGLLGNHFVTILKKKRSGCLNMVTLNHQNLILNCLMKKSHKNLKKVQTEDNY